MPRLLIFCEDNYGVDFFKKLISDLKEKTLIERNFKTKIIHINADCNYAINKQICAAVELNNYNPNKILLIVDGDGNVDKKRQSTEKHVDAKYKDKTTIIVIATEIEEWICISQDIHFNEKPSKFLKRNQGYKKRNLPKMVCKLDYGLLINRSPNFRSFFNELRSLH